MSIRDVCVWLSALVLIGMHAEVTASCDISGASVMLQGVEKRDGTPARSQMLDPATQRPAQSKAEPRETSPATGSKPEQADDGAKPAALRRN
jgi:hypothetical protein